MKNFTSLIIFLFICALIFVVYHLHIKEPQLPRAPVGDVQVFMDQAPGKIPKGFEKVKVPDMYSDFAG